MPDETPTPPKLEIAITPEMVAAGRCELVSFDPGYNNHDTVVNIFRAMIEEARIPGVVLQTPPRSSR